jgi:hypothetical protein
MSRSGRDVKSYIFHSHPKGVIRLMKMSKRWGSFSKTGAILLNTELIKAPLCCIDYVIDGAKQKVEACLEE